MGNFEVSTVVGSQGDIHLAGLPFTPGTEVEIVVSPKEAAPSNGRLASLLLALDRAHNVESVGPLRRDDLYDCDSIR